MSAFPFPNPDLAMTVDFLAALDSSGVFTFQTFGDQKNNRDPSLNRVMHGTLEQHVESLIKLNSRGAGVFVMVNEGDGVIRDGAKTCRTNSNVLRVRSIFVDLDGAPIEPIWALPEPPTIVVESSPNRWHAYWVGVPCPLEDFAAAQSSLAKRFESDPSVKDLARVMRLPGLWHQKADPFMSRIELLKGNPK